MNFKIIHRTNALEVIPSGRLDIIQAEDFEINFVKILKGNSEKSVGINLSSVEYVDSSGLGVLIKVLNEAKNQGQTMMLFGAQPKIQNVFQLARLEKFFHFVSQSEFDLKHPDREDHEVEEI